MEGMRPLEPLRPDAGGRCRACRRPIALALRSALREAAGRRGVPRSFVHAACPPGGAAARRLAATA
jgi:hypothetical protein